MLLSFVIAALIHRVVSPDLLALAVLQVILPLTLVAGAILMNIDTVAVGLVIKPFALEDVAVHVPELAVAASLIEAPMSFIFGTILPDLHAVAVLHVTEPLASVSRSILEVNFTALLELGFIDVLHVEVRIIHRVAFVRRGVVLMVRVHLEKLRADPLSGDDAARPSL